MSDPRSDETAPSITSRQAVLDLCVVSLGGLGQVLSHFVPIPRRWFIGGVVVILIAYVVGVLARRGERLRDYGVRGDNLSPALREVGLFTLLAALGIVVFAWQQGRSLWRPELAFLLPLYPLWGVVQQLIFQGIAHRRLLQLTRPGLALLGGALIFASVHLNNLPLTGLTFLAGLAWCWLYQRQANVWALGLSHGVLAALSFPLLLGDNPLVRL